MKSIVPMWIHLIPSKFRWEKGAKAEIDPSDSCFCNIIMCLKCVRLGSHPSLVNRRKKKNRVDWAEAFEARPNYGKPFLNLLLTNFLRNAYCCRKCYSCRSRGGARLNALVSWHQLIHRSRWEKIGYIKTHFRRMAKASCCRLPLKFAKTESQPNWLSTEIEPPVLPHRIMNYVEVMNWVCGERLFLFQFYVSRRPAPRPASTNNALIDIVLCAAIQSMNQLAIFNEIAKIAANGKSENITQLHTIVLYCICDFCIGSFKNNFAVIWGNE